MTYTTKRAHQLKQGDRICPIGKDGPSHLVTGTSRAVPNSPDRIAIIGERNPGHRTPVWFFDLNQIITVCK